jgi:hypothetical protein
MLVTLFPYLVGLKSLIQIDNDFSQKQKGSNYMDNIEKENKFTVLHFFEKTVNIIVVIECRA